MKDQKLNQIVAIEKGVKSRVYSEITMLHKSNQKVELFNGFTKNYKPKEDGGETFPPENKKVQLFASEVLGEFSKALTELLDITAAKDWANCKAVADVVVEGETLIKDAPTPYLLFLEKQINDIRTYIETLPILDTSEEWMEDVNSGLYKTSAVTSHRTKKIQKAIVLYEATEKHPAQTQLITEDVTVGHWNVVKHSGAIPLPKKKQMLDKLEKLAKAVKYSREKANSIEAESIQIGAKIFKYLLD
jgi:hypothetical protein